LASKKRSIWLLAGEELELPMNRLQFGDFLGLRPVRRFQRATAFEHRHQRENLVEILLRDFGHEAAAARLQRHQAFRGKHLERFTQGRTADAVIDRQQLLVDPIPRLQFMRKNPLP
jgi:hypothetical protein